MKFCEIGAGHNRWFGWKPEAFAEGDELTVIDLPVQSFGLFSTPVPVPLTAEDAIEAGNDSAEINIQRMEAAAQLGKFTCFFTHGDACRTDFSDGYFDILLLKNVIGDPRSEARNLLEEVARISKSVVVVEEYSPVEAYPFMEGPDWLKIDPEIISDEIDTYIPIAEVWISNS